MIEQRTQDWLNQRKGRITASISGAILNCHPFLKRNDVMRKMVRDYYHAEDESIDNPAMAYGRAHEEIAKQSFQLKYGLKIEKCGFFEYEHWLGASPDGLIDEDAVYEGKSPYSQKNAEVPVFKTIKELPHYYAQVQIEMLCSKRTKAYFHQWALNGDALEIVYLDKEWFKKNWAMLVEFYIEYIEELKPENSTKYLEPLWITAEGIEYESLLKEFDYLGKIIEKSNERKKQLIATIATRVDGKNTIINGRKFSHVEKKTISYKDALKELVPEADLSKFTTISRYWKLSGKGE